MRVLTSAPEAAAGPRYTRWEGYSKGRATCRRRSARELAREYIGESIGDKYYTNMCIDIYIYILDTDVNIYVAVDIDIDTDRHRDRLVTIQAAASIAASMPAYCRAASLVESSSQFQVCPQLPLATKTIICVGSHSKAYIEFIGNLPQRLFW